MPDLPRLHTVSLDAWDGLYASAVAEGCGRVLDRESERVAATDESRAKYALS